MSDKKPNLDSLFKAAFEIESPEERSAFVQRQCGDDKALRAQLEQLLASDARAGGFLEKPAAELDATLAPDFSREQSAASLASGLAPAFGQKHAVVRASSDHSVLRTLGHTIDVPRVSLREAEGDQEAPVERAGSPEVPSSSTFGRYRVDGEIARGGMGAILKGRDTDLGRDLAIKVLLDEHKNRPDVIQRFIEEAQIGGQLQHPGIAPVYDLGQFADQRPFFTMKLVKGQTLSKLLTARKNPSEERSRFIGIFEQVCQTLGYAHARGVIHRDLKPSNIMVGAFGEVQVMDWGLAKVLSSGGVADEKRAHLRHKNVSIIETRRSAGSDALGSTGSGSSETQMGSVLGTPAYMPPEQALGEIDQLNQRADVFGLGAILCEILTGKPPYVAEDGAAVFRLATRGKLTGAFERLDNCGADGELIALAKQCLAPESDDRPHDAGAVAEQVSHYLESVESKLRVAEQERAAEVVRVVEQRKRLKVTLVLAGLVVAILVAGISATVWFAVQATNNYNLAEARAGEERAQRLRANDAEQLANQRLETEVAATRRAEAAVKVARESLFDLNTAFGLAAADSNRPAEALLWFAEAASHAEPGSHQEQTCLNRHASWLESAPRLLNFVEHGPQGLRTLDFSPRGRFLASLTETGQSNVWDIRGRARSIFSENRIVDQVWHAERPWLVTATANGRVRVIEIPSGEVLHEVECQKPVTRLACDDRGQNIAICGNAIDVWDLGDGTLTTIGTTEDAVVQTVMFSPDGSLVLASCDDDRARLFATQSPTPSPLRAPIPHRGTGFPGQPILAPTFVNQGRGILTKSGSAVLWTRLDDESDPQRIPVGAVNVTSITNGPDGKFLLTDQGGGFQIWDARGDEALSQKKLGREVMDTAFSPDGLDVLFMTGDAVYRRRVIDGEPYGSSIKHPSTIRHLRVSGDGRQIAIADQGGGIAIWEWGTYMPHYLSAEPSEGIAVLNGRVRQRLLSASGTRVKRSPSGDYFLLCGGNYLFGTMRRVTLHSSEDGAVVDAMPSEAIVLDACVAPDERTLALANLDHEVFVWQRGDPGSKRLLAIVDAEPMRIEFGPDATTLIVLHIDGTLSCFDTTSGSQVWQSSHPEVTVPPHRRQRNLNMYRQANGFPIMQFQAYDLQPSSDRRYVATTCWNELACVWNAQDGSLKVPPIRHAEGNIERIALSPDFRWLAIAGQKTAEVWDTADATRQRQFSLASRGTGLAFDSSGERLAICVDGGDCTIWNWQSQELSCRPIRGTNGVFFGQGDQLFWSNRGLRGGGYGEVTLWSAVTGNPVTPSWPIGKHGEAYPMSSQDRNACHFTNGSFIFSVIIGQLHNPRAIPIGQRRLEAEILSTQRIDSGKVVKLSATEWSERIESMRSSNPEFFASRLEHEALIAWHLDQRWRGLQEFNLHAAAWHGNALRELLGGQYEDQQAHESELNLFLAIKHAQAGEIEQAASHAGSLALEQADRLAIFSGAFGLEFLLGESEKLIDQLKAAGHDDEAKRVFDFMLRNFAARFGPGDSRVRNLGYALSKDYWQRGLRPESIEYLRIAAEESPLKCPPLLFLMLLAAGQWQQAEDHVRHIIENSAHERIEQGTLAAVAQTAVVLPMCDAPLAERCLELITRAANANPDNEASKLMMGLAQLRAGKTESALDSFRAITGTGKADSPEYSSAYAAIAIGLANQGDTEAAQAALDNAQQSRPSAQGTQSLQPDILIAESLLLEATRLLRN